MSRGISGHHSEKGLLLMWLGEAERLQITLQCLGHPSAEGYNSTGSGELMPKAQQGQMQTGCQRSWQKHLPQVNCLY